MPSLCSLRDGGRGLGSSKGQASKTEHQLGPTLGSLWGEDLAGAVQPHPHLLLLLVRRKRSYLYLELSY